MGDPWTVFVEGKSDKAFVRCLLQFLDISNVEVQRIGGGIDKLKEVAKLMQQHHDAGNRIAIILDADSDPQKRRKEFEKKKSPSICQSNVYSLYRTIRSLVALRRYWNKCLRLCIKQYIIALKTTKTACAVSMKRTRLPISRREFLHTVRRSAQKRARTKNTATRHTGIWARRTSTH